jgi:hypothetical protein
MSHTYFWFFQELADGGHVSGDFLEAGVTLHLPERIAGFLTAGIPLAIFSLSLFQLHLLFRSLTNNETDIAPISKKLGLSADFALFGSVTMMIYPTILSFLYFVMNSMEQNMIILSVEPLVVVLFIISILFFLVIRSLHQVLQNQTHSI